MLIAFTFHGLLSIDRHFEFPLKESQEICLLRLGFASSNSTADLSSKVQGNSDGSTIESPQSDMVNFFALRLKFFHTDFENRNLESLSKFYVETSAVELI